MKHNLTEKGTSGREKQNRAALWDLPWPCMWCRSVVNHSPLSCVSQLASVTGDTPSDCITMHAPLSPLTITVSWINNRKNGFKIAI